MKHTPTPWVVGEFDETLGYDCMTGGWPIRQIGEMNSLLVIDQADYGQKHCDWNFRSDEAKANAAFIVRAVNCHDELVAALQRINKEWMQLPALDVPNGVFTPLVDAILDARDIIARATQS